MSGALNYLIRNTMNIPPDQAETSREHPTTPVTTPNRHARYNINQPESMASIEDNNHYPTYANNDLGAKSCRRKGIHQNTISNFIKEIEEQRQHIENEIHQAVDDDRPSCESMASDDSETCVKAPYDDPVKLRRTRTKRANKQYVQYGNANIMFVFEPIKSTSMDYYKQIGDKNIMVHVNISSNQCQLLDQNDMIIPIDTNGEVWLEIKRRSRVRDERGETQSPTRDPCNFNTYVDIPTHCTSDANHGRRSPNHGRRSPNGGRRSPNHGRRSPSGGRRSPNHGRRSPSGGRRSPKHGRRSPTEHSDIKYDHGRSSPTENTDSLGTLSDYLEDDGHYSTISVLEGSNDLNIRFGKYSDESELDLENPDKSQILSHKKVLDFLRDKGNDFDVTIHDWEYKKESVYSYIPSVAIDRVHTAFYQQSDLDAVTEDVEKMDDGLYSKPNLGARKVVASPTSPTDPNKRPLPKIPTQNGKLHKLTSGPAAPTTCEKKPMIYPRTNKNTDASNDTAAHTKKPPTNLRPLDISEARNPSPLPLPLRPPTSPQQRPTSPRQPPTNPRPRPFNIADATNQSPPPLPLRPPTSPQQAGCATSPRIPRERRPLILPPPPGSTSKENLDQYAWYHGKLEQGSGKHMLMNQENGSFLVRDSQGKVDNHKYTIEFRDGEEYKKLMIVKTDDKYHFSETNSKTFASVVDMVETIIDTGLEVKDSDTNCWKTIKVKPAAKHRSK